MDQPRSLGLVRIGTIDVALPVDALEAVVRGPLTLTDFPRAPRHVLGAFAWRGQALPALDLAALLQPAAAAPARPVAFALILRHGAGRFAVQIDDMLGIVTAPPDRLTPLNAPAAPALFHELYQPPDGGRIAVLLDLDAVLELAEVRTALTRDNSATAATTTTAPARPFVRFTVATQAFALESTAVRAVLPCPPALDSPLHYAVLRGFHGFRGRNLPILDLLALLDLPPAAPATHAHLLILEHAGCTLGLLVDTIAGIDSVAATTLQPLDAAGFTHPEHFLGHYLAAASVVLALSPAALFDSEHLLGLIDESFAAETAATAENAAATGHYLVFRTGGRTLATELIELEAVVNLPATALASARPGHALVALAEHRAEPLKILDLSLLLGGRPTPLAAAAPVLVVRTAAGCVGYLVDRLEFHQTAAPLPLPPHYGQLGAHGPAFQKMIRARNGDFQASATLLSLRDLAGTPPAAALSA